MKFRPCIDLHNGQVKQIVGSTLKDNDNTTDIATATSSDASGKAPSDDGGLAENFATDRPASDFAEMYQRDALTGGHVIMLGPGNREAAMSALAAYPKGLQVGGGVNDTNALEWLEAGASHVIVTSHVFKDGKVNFQRLERLVGLVGKEQLVLDLSCRRKPGDDTGPYYVVTDRWQKYTELEVNSETLERLGSFCDEFLIHGVDVEGKQSGILDDLVILLGEASPVPITYAGGVRSIEDMERVKSLGRGKVDLTIGSALDCFGGKLRYSDVVDWHNQQKNDTNTT